MAARFHRIEAIFGGRLDQITFAQLAALVGNTDAFEDEDLDYKSIHYAQDKKTELAKDVAAMANTIGGVLVLGLAEDRKSRCPSAVVPVELTDGRLRQIRATVASNLRPAPRIELIAKEDAPGSNQGILLIAVPRSPDAPHAVIEHNQDHRLAYPYRDGDTTRWLTEAQVATSYRRRFQELTERGDRLTRVETDVEDTTDDLARSFHRAGGHALLTVSLVPDVPGDMVINNRTIRGITEQELRAAPLIGRTSAPFTQTRVGHRRIILLDHGQPPDFVAELHSDGSGAWAVSVPTWPLTTNEANPWGHGADTDAIVTLVLSALRHLARHAVTRTGASGTTTLRTQLISRTPTGSPVLLPGTTPRWQALHLAHQRLSGHESGIRVGTTANRTATGQAHTLLDDLADGATPLLQAASLLIGDLFQHYGLAEAPQLARDGTLNAMAWAEPERTLITTWAKQVGIATA